MAEATIRQNFIQIGVQMKELQITHAEWKKYMTVKKEWDIIAENNFMTLAYMYLRIVVAIPIAIFFLLLLLFAVFTTGKIPQNSLLGSLHYEISEFYIETIDGAKISNENCVIPFYEPVQDLFRPPVNCGMCVNLTSVDIRVNLSREEFKEKYAYSSRPLLVVDAMDGWSAIDTFSFEFFKKVYPPGSRALEIVQDHCQFFPYKTSFEKLGEVFNMTEDEAYLRTGSDTKPWYIGWSNCDSVSANSLRKHYKKPYFLPKDSESSKLDWIFMGSPGYGAPNHIDAVDLPSWQAQVKGRKIWTITPPPECYFECGAEMDVTLHPGSIIIVDTNKWFHSTRVIGDEMSITIGSEYD